MTQDSGGGISKDKKTAYVKGLVDGIEKAVPPKGGMCTSTFTGGDFAKTILAYAWPRYYSPPHIDAQPAYKAAVKKASSQGRYVGGGAHPGIDCGGFVTTLMVDSGFEPKYNSSGKGGNVPVQEAWAAKNWKKLGSNPNAADMKPGDVAYTGEHTFTYAGTIPGFGSKIASASYSTSGQAWRAPMAGHETVGYPGSTWYRKK
jgi:hypothetical protein